MKKYEYKIYSKGGSYITTWDTEVISTPNFDWSINSGVGALTVTLKRPFSSFGEGQDVWFENQLRLEVFDKENPDGKLIYTGRLNEYKPYFGDEEKVDVSFLGYITELDDRYLRDETSDDAINSQLLLPSGLSLQYKLFNQKFNPDPNSGFLALAYRFTSNHGNISRVGIQAYTDKSGNYQQNTVFGIMEANLVAGISQQGNEITFYRPGRILASGVIASSLLPSGTSTGIQQFTVVNLPQRLYTEVNKQYYAFIAGSGIIVPVYTASDFGWNGQDANYGWNFNANVATSQGVNTNTNASAFMEGLGNITYFSNTSPLYSSEDPTDIMEDIIKNKYSGHVTWNEANQSTGYLVTYQFNKYRVSEAISKCLDLSDPNWYYYVDANNVLTFKRRDYNIIDHTLRLGYEITSCAPTKTVNELKTRTLFVGGVGAGVTELYDEEDWWWQNDQYSLREHLMQDGRVFKRDTAKQLQRTYLDAHYRPITYMTIDVLDSNHGHKFGYDIESFMPGQFVRIIDPKADNFQNQDGIFDAGFVLDETQLDISDTHIFSEPLQILKIQYKGRMATLSLGTILLDTPRRIEDIYREQQKDNTKDSSLS